MKSQFHYKISKLFTIFNNHISLKSFVILGTLQRSA